MDFSQFEREFTTTEKLKAFCYHVYMVTIGRKLQPVKYNTYLKTFLDFKEYQRKNRDLQVRFQQQ